MKILQTEVTGTLNSHISFIERDEPYFKSPFHNHPELELVYIKESYGRRIIGNKIESFEAGDLVFIGANLPHVWLNDEIYYKKDSQLRAKAVVIYFNKDVFGKAFYDLKEAYRVIDFFKRAERGIKITGKTQEVLSEKIEQLMERKDFEKIIGLFEILHILSLSDDFSYIISDASCPSFKTETDRLAEVYRYMKENFRDDISLQKIAAIANLTPQSFCRLFKKRTGNHFLEYLTQLRIDNACKMLIETDNSISEIAYTCGFKTVSNFNKLFKEITHQNPKSYRAALGKELQQQE